MTKLEKFFNSTTDLALSFLPFIFVAFIFSIVGKFNIYLDRPDIFMFYAVLFSEGWWRARKNENLKGSEKSATEFFGVIGAIFSVGAATVLMLEAEGVCSMSLQSSPVINWGKPVLFLLAILYAFYVRLTE